MTFAASQSLNDAMLVNGINTWLDADPVNPAYAILYDAGNVALVTMIFAKPAAALVAHQLVFAQAQTAGDMIGTQGSAVTFQLFNGLGDLGGMGDVSDMAGAGALKVSGTTGTLLYQGARAILGSLKFA